MRVIIQDSAAEVASVASEHIAEVVRARRADGNPAVLGVATGSSPLGTYAALAKRVQAGELDMTGVKAFALDEYVGLEPSHPESYSMVIGRTVTEQLGLDPADVRVPNGLAADMQVECAEFEQAIVDAGGIDLQLLGIGSNGHIGFNEPTSSFGSRTRPKTLTPQTRQDNARFFESLDHTPMHCVTQGIGTILDARSLLLVAQGESKAAAVAAMIEGPLSSMCPASALQMHRRATVIIDRAAAQDLQLTEYYLHVERNLGKGRPLA